MKYNVKEIIGRVRVYLDFNREDNELVVLDDADALSVDEIIRSKLVEATRSVLLAAPAAAIDTARPLEGGVSWQGSVGQGMGVLLLPTDFLRLLSVMMSDWKRPAQIISEADEEYRWQSLRHVCGNPDRPVAAVVRYPDGVAVEMYSSRGGEGVTLKRGLYVSEPQVDSDDMIDIPHLLLDDVVKTCGEMTRMTLDGKGTPAETSNIEG